MLDRALRGWREALRKGMAQLNTNLMGQERTTKPTTNATNLRIMVETYLSTFKFSAIFSL